MFDEIISGVDFSNYDIKYKDLIKELEENKNRFEQQLSQLETAEGRDKLKLAYLFYNFI